MKLHLQQEFSITRRRSGIYPGAVDEIARDCLLTRMRRLSRILTGIYDDALRPYGVNGPQFSLLVVIADLGHASRAEIGRANAQDRSTLTRNLALLLADGLIEEEVFGERGRSRTIAVSQSGLEVLAAATPAWRAAQATARRRLGRAGAAALVRMGDSLTSAGRGGEVQ